MSVFSMTGFGKGESQDDLLELSVEVKSVNNRFKDYRFRMGSVFSSDEIKLKREIEKKFKRGSFDVNVQYKKRDSQASFDDICESKIGQFINKISNIKESKGVELNIRPVDFLRSEFYKDRDEGKDEALKKLLHKAFADCLDKLKASRKEEGEKLVKILLGHLEQYEKNFSTIISKKSDYQKNIEQSIRAKFSEFQSDLKVDEPRFLQEVIFYLEKLDIDEEINRIKVHLDKLKNLLEQGGELGRQIDFLVQELNRETNTIGSKSGNQEISESVVQMKVQLEKIREQALNLE